MGVCFSTAFQANKAEKPPCPRTQQPSLKDLTFEAPHLKPTRRPSPSFNAKAHAGVAWRAGRSPSVARKLPKQKTRSPRAMTEYRKPVKVIPWEWRDTKASGVVRGECRGGLGGAAAPNRPPSAARRAGGRTKEEKNLRAPRYKWFHKNDAILLCARRHPRVTACRSPRRRPKWKNQTNLLLVACFVISD